MESSKSSSWLCGRRIKSSLISFDLIIEKADNYLESLVNNKTFSGSILLARNNQILLIKGYGYSQQIQQERNTSQTIYRLGSVTKPFTATIILKLYERNLLNLNSKLNEFISDYPQGNQITIKHLLSNTSGIEDYTNMESFEEKCSENLTIDQLIDLFKNQPLKFPPGSEYNYSNSNFILLGLIIEKVTGKSYEKNLQEIILDPCHMRDTNYECDCKTIMNSKSQQRACGYVCNRDANGFETCRYIDMSTARSAGGISSTIEDLYRFDRYLYGEKILNNRTKKLMFKPVKEHYALGWEIHRLKHGKIKQQHCGEIFGFISCLARFPQDNACIIILSNLEQTDIEDMLDNLINILFDKNSI